MRDRALPVYYVPREDVRMDLLERIEHRTHCQEWWMVVGDRIGKAVVLAALNIIARKTNLSPLPKPPSLAIADILRGATTALGGIHLARRSGEVRPVAALPS